MPNLFLSKKPRIKRRNLSSTDVPPAASWESSDRDLDTVLHDSILFQENIVNRWLADSDNTTVNSSKTSGLLDQFTDVFPIVSHPWAGLDLVLCPPIKIDMTTKATRPRSLSGLFKFAGAVPPPFPRYGHSVPATATPAGDLYIFGGLVRKVARNDRYLLSTRDRSVKLLQTSRDVPNPRVGHECALFRNVLIVWGGDTNLFSSKKKLDANVYLLNLSSQEWTKVTVHDPAPVGRYGHTITISNDNFFVFGGQTETQFLNDLWRLDVNSLKTGPIWEFIEPNGQIPARRAGHVCVAYEDQIFIFGGTDGEHYYNDLWRFDIHARQWSELHFIGSVPPPRKGHAAALVGDVLYIFGGLGEDGKDLDDLYAFKISRKYWFKCQNMGPTPSGRSGHAMVSVDTKIYLLGGESLSNQEQDYPGTVHILNTNKIEYPCLPAEFTSRERLMEHLDFVSETDSIGPSDEYGTVPEQLNQKTESVDKNLNLIDKIQAVLTDKEKYRKLLACQGSNVQRLLNTFQRLLDTSKDLSPEFRCSLIVATQRLAAVSGRYPMSYELTEIATSDMSEYAGGFADIYKGDFRGRPVSLKTIRLHKNTQVAHFIKVVSKEAILWGQLHHPNILPFYGIYRFKSWISLVAPWMDNGDIVEYLEYHTHSSRVVLAYEVARGLNFLHENKIIHGDLKGKNVLINEQGRVCLADFGLSSISDKEILAWTSHSSAASKGGSVRWQAPELFDPEGDVEKRNTEASDIYAWACVAYEIFSGEIPLVHLNRDVTVIKQVTKGERPAQPSKSSPSWTVWGLNQSIWTIMQACWSIHPAERPSTQTMISLLAPALTTTDWLAIVLSPNSHVETTNAFLSSRVFREMVRSSSDDDLISIEALESLVAD